MPLFDFHCLSCNHVFEELVKNSGSLLKECPKCHKTTGLEKLVSTPYFQFKGTGFPSNDVKNERARIKQITDTY